MKLTNSTDRRWEPLISAMLPFILIMLTVGIFWPATDGPFIFDDYPNLEQLRFLDGELSVESMRRYLASISGPPHRPLAMLSFAIEDFTWPAYPEDFKRNNLLLHVLAGLLIVLLSARLFSFTDVTGRAGLWLSFGVGAAWLLSPLQLSSTMLVVQRMNILSTICVLLGCLTYLAVLTSRDYIGPGRALLGLAVAGAFGVLGYLCKENAALLILYIIVINCTLLRHCLHRARGHTAVVIHLSTFGPVLLAVGAVLYSPESLLTGYQFREFTLEERLLTQPRVLLEYIQQALIPRLSSQGIFHDNYPFSTGFFAPPSTLIAIAVVVGLISSALYFRRTFPVYSFSVLWFFCGHALESSFIGLEMYFEHRNYLPILGLYFGIGYLTWKFRSRLTFALAFSWLILIALMTHVNARTWGSRSLQAHIWQLENRDSPRAAQWATSYLLDAGQTAEAEMTFNEAVARMPHRSELQLQQLYLSCLIRGMDAHAKFRFVQVSENMEYSLLAPAIFGQLVKQYMTGGCHNSLRQEDLLSFGQAIMRNPIFARDPQTLATIHYEIAKIFPWEGGFEERRHHLEESFELEPNPLVARELAVYALANGLPALALKYLNASEAAPRPWMKRLLLDISAQNRTLREAVEQELKKVEHK